MDTKDATNIVTETAKNATEIVTKAADKKQWVIGRRRPPMETTKNLSSVPLKMIQIPNIVMLLTFYSPIILVVCILSLSFAYQKFQGAFYLVCCVVVIFFRSVIMNYFQIDPFEPSSNDICSMVQYSYGSYGNATFSMFFLAFSIVYMCLPMIVNNQINYTILCVFLFYFVMDVGIRYRLNCVTSFVSIILNILIGAIVGGFIVMCFYMANMQSVLFFNKADSSTEVCSMPSKQTFKCSVYKNGELVGTTNAPA